MKLWSGRFSSDTDALVDELNASIAFDKRLYKEDIAGSIAHAGMLGEQGIIEKEEANKIIVALDGILSDIEAGNFEFRLEDEDIHMSVEAELTRRIGDAGKRLHTARSRNDQVALDFRMYLKNEMETIRDSELNLISALLEIAGKNMATIMPAYTHLQRAQPTTFAHYMMAYANMLRRDVTRLEDCLARMDEMPLGSGALTGTTYPIDRRRVADALGFARITENSLDGVSDRDYALELLSDLSILMMHLSRFAEEIILWCSWEFKFIELSDAYSTGSSIMPQKKNPDIAELTRGMSGTLIGNIAGFLATMKAMPLAYNRDLAEDKRSLFETNDLLELILPAFAGMVATLEFDVGKLREEAPRGFTLATEVADWLVGQNVPFAEAHEITGAVVRYCEERGHDLSGLTEEDLPNIDPRLNRDVLAAVALDKALASRTGYGATAPVRVREQIARFDTALAARRAFAETPLKGTVSPHETNDTGEQSSR